MVHQARLNSNELQEQDKNPVDEDLKDSSENDEMSGRCSGNCQGIVAEFQFWIAFCSWWSPYFIWS